MLYFIQSIVGNSLSSKVDVRRRAIRRAIHGGFQYELSEPLIKITVFRWDTVVRPLARIFSLLPELGCGDLPQCLVRQLEIDMDGCDGTIDWV